MNILTLIKISWRNVWRNKLRSFVVIISVVFGLLGGIIIIAMSYGLNEERMNNAVKTYLSHIQIHNRSFSEDYNIKHTIGNLEAIENAINNDNRVVSYSKRIILNGMLSNSNGSYGIQVKGLDPAKEIKVTNTYEKLIEGEYFKSKRDNTILVGKKLAERLNLIDYDQAIKISGSRFSILKSNLALLNRSLINFMLDWSNVGWSDPGPS